MRTLAALALAALALTLAACESGRLGSPSQPWDEQQRLERGHYG